jgi:hypothetical protein
MRVKKGVPKGNHNDKHVFEHCDTGTGALSVGKDAGMAQRCSGGLPDDEAMSDEDDDEDDIMQGQQSASCVRSWVRGIILR